MCSNRLCFCGNTPSFSWVWCLISVDYFLILSTILISSVSLLWSHLNHMQIQSMFILWSHMSFLALSQFPTDRVSSWSWSWFWDNNCNFAFHGTSILSHVSIWTHLCHNFHPYVWMISVQKSVCLYRYEVLIDFIILSLVHIYSNLRSCSSSASFLEFIYMMIRPCWSIILLLLSWNACIWWLG